MFDLCTVFQGVLVRGPLPLLSQVGDMCGQWNHHLLPVVHDVVPGLVDRLADRKAVRGDRGPARAILSFWGLGLRSESVSERLNRGGGSVRF